jgi:uncharacterized protein
MVSLDANTQQKWKKLLDWFLPYKRVGVALSGGVDSALVCAAAVNALGKENVIALSVQSPMELPQEVSLAAEIARFLGLKHVVLHMDELKDERIAANPVDRCYFCKLIRMEKINTAAKEHNLQVLMDGSNADDLDDYRPGRNALQEVGVFSPLAEVGIPKAMVRQLAKWQSLSVWDKPSTPCLASRFPYGVAIDQQKIQQVACAEAFLKQNGFAIVRVRYHQEVARVEIPGEDFELFLTKREEINEHLTQCGFKYVTLDLQGFRSGSLNEGIK